MSYEADAARSYRWHAGRLRTIAGSGVGRAIREALNRVAADFEHMAQTLDALDRAHRRIRDKRGDAKNLPHGLKPR